MIDFDFKFSFSVQLKETVSGDSLGGAPPKTKTRSCDLDNHDQFWMGHKGAPFPLVTLNVFQHVQS